MKKKLYFGQHIYDALGITHKQMEIDENGNVRITGCDMDKKVIRYEENPNEKLDELMKRIKALRGSGIVVKNVMVSDEEVDFSGKFIFCSNS